MRGAPSARSYNLEAFAGIEKLLPGGTMSDLTLIDAVNAGDSAAAEQLMMSGAEVNQKDEQGWTPLNFAAGKGDLPMTRLLIDNGADVFNVGRDRRTPYMIALAAGRVSVVKYLSEVEDRLTGEVA